MNEIINNKWLLVSCLQKSIRRGFEEEAVILWRKLKDIDRFYAIYRLSIMAIEDIGLGNIDILYDFLSTGLKKVNLEQKGGNDYIEFIVRELAKSVKDRSACDISWLASNDDWTDEKIIHKYKEIYQNENITLRKRVLAGWLMVGTKKIKHNIVKDFDEQSNILDFIEFQKANNIDEKIITIVEQSYAYQKEPHLFALPLLYQKLQQEQNIQIGRSQYKTGDFKEHIIEKNIIDIEGLPIILEGIDGHTSEGKKIIQKLIREKDLQEEMKSLSFGEQEYLLKHILFQLEGQVVNKRLIYPTGINVYKEAQNFYKNSQVDFIELSKKVEQKIPYIQKLRRDIFKKPINKYFL